jgi:hypothetical protein
MFDVCGCYFLNVADVVFECCEFPSSCCMQYGLMLRRDFFLLLFFNATMTHLTPIVDLTALRPSGDPRPSYVRALAMPKSASPPEKPRKFQLRILKMATHEIEMKHSGRV